MMTRALVLTLLLGVCSVMAGQLTTPAVAADDPPHPFVTLVGERVDDPSKPFTLIIRMKANPGMGDAFVKGFAPAITATLKEKGCLQYELSRDTENPDSFLLYERWKSLPDLAAHLKTDHIAELGKAMEGSRAESSAEVHLPVGN